MFGRLFASRRRLKELTLGYEKKIFDLNQLIEISKSLNSNLDFNNLVQSILYICMGQLKVLKAGLFARRDIDRADLHLHRSQVGFDIDRDTDYLIPAEHPVLAYLQDNFRSHGYAELAAACPAALGLPALSSLEPYMVVPLRSKSVINGILVLGDPIEGMGIRREDREYVLNIAHLAGIAVHNAFLYEITTTDMMTKLKLRHYLVDALQEQMLQSRAEQTPLSLIMVDIDHFKRLNDSRGHVAGDQVIRETARAILANVRQTDVAARYGGEEFLLMLPDSTRPEAAAIAERIRTGVEAIAFEFGAERESMTVSLGVAEFEPARDLTVPGFIERADAAMYASKRAGRNRVSLAD